MRRLIWAVLILLAFARAACAQDVFTITGAVTTRPDHAPLPGANVSVDGAFGMSAFSDESGKFTLRITSSVVRNEYVRLRVEAAGLETAFAQVHIHVGSPITVTIALRVAYAEDVVVGSRTPGAAAEKAVPLDVITREAIAASSYTETAQLLESLAPSLNFPRPSISDGTDTVRPATLRGLGPDQVLVLVNGKRRHQSALVHLNDTIGRGSTGVDLNAIPIAAIERIEILRDGAAAQYGSDAIAGVINIVLKSGADPLTVTANVGLAKGSFTGNSCTPNGLTCTPGNAITFSDGGLADIGGSWGLAAGKGTITASVEYRHHNRTNRASFDPRDQIVAGDAGTNDVTEPNHRWGDPDTRDLMTLVSALVPINSAETRFFYAFGGYSRRAANSPGFFRRALDARNWPEIYPRGFLPVIKPTVVDASVTAGVRGLAGRWSYDVSGVYGQNSFAFTIGDTLNVSLGPSLPPNRTEFDAGSLKLNQVVANVDVNRTLNGPFAGPVSLAIGAEVRREHYQIVAGEPDSYGDGGAPNQFGGRAAIGAQVFPGFRPSNEVNASRHSVASYVDAEADLVPRLRMGVAVRAERYSDFGSTVDGKVTARVEIHPTAIARASFSTGFRAPSLGQSFFSSTATNFLNLGQGLVPVESLTLPVSSAPAQALGAEALKPEQSRHLSGGMALSPSRRLNMAVDGYWIAIDDRIVLSGNFTAPSIAVLLAPFGANSARFFTNAINTRTRGIDVSSDYQASLGAAGTLKLRAGYNYTRSRIVGTIATPPQLAGFEAVLFDRIEQRRLECGQPRDSVRLGGEWRRERVGASIGAARYGEICSFLTANPADDQVYAPKWLTDVEVSYRLGGYVVAAGAQNMFNVLPDANSTVNSFNGIQTFPRHSPFGMNGRQIYARVRWQF